MKTLITLQGPTGVGKTELSLRLAEFFDTCILNADSRQVYRDIPIGTAAPTEAERQRVPHHFVGMLALDDYYSAAQYESDVLRLLNDEVFPQKDVAILSGGSMMYIDAVCKGIDDIPTIDAETREMMRERYEREGLEPLAEELRLLDPDYYAECDIRNPKRVVHALEICYMTGRTYTSFRVRRKAYRPFRIIKVGLQREREELYARINRRVDSMMQDGWLDEARRVLPFRHCNSLNTVGYKELFKYLDGEWELDFALEKIRRNTRVYSRKQMTWFRRDEEVRWFHPEDENGILDYLQAVLKTPDLIQ
ncbi:MAG: tRNA (adenosine(37)-N6)-dimethylallyltransferase MiaA [Bacteroidaceae bacterium]|nr:tRNA (adenosine(37)-N6)-dimethylallyltransferase MiaA [Bacteroidaceae bacterium]